MPESKIESEFPAPSPPCSKKRLIILLVILGVLLLTCLISPIYFLFRSACNGYHTRSNLNRIELAIQHYHEAYDTFPDSREQLLEDGFYNPARDKDLIHNATFIKSQGATQPNYETLTIEYTDLITDEPGQYVVKPETAD